MKTVIYNLTMDDNEVIFPTKKETFDRMAKIVGIPEHLLGFDTDKIIGVTDLRISGHQDKKK